jgi:hypothetical protein
MATTSSAKTYPSWQCITSRSAADRATSVPERGVTEVPQARWRTARTGSHLKRFTSECGRDDLLAVGQPVTRKRQGQGVSTGHTWATSGGIEQLLTATHGHGEPVACAHVHAGKRVPHIPIFQAGDAKTRHLVLRRLTACPLYP